METLAEKILNEKVNHYIDFINRQAPRRFDKRIDDVRVELTERQFFFVEKQFKPNKNSFCFKDYKVTYHFNNRMNKYELRFFHFSYIEDFDERADYIDGVYGY